MSNVLVVGLGIMGGAIANSLKELEHQVYGFDIEDSCMRRAAANGVHVDHLEHCLARSEVVISSLPSASALSDLERNLVVTSPKVIVEMSTFSLADKVRFKAALTPYGHVVLDCPISGTGAQAAKKDLVIYASGDSRIIEDLKGVFKGFARVVFNVGEYGNGTRMKLVANLLVAIHNVATAEAMLLAKRSGLDLDQVVECIGAGAGSSCVFLQRAPLMITGRYEPPSMKLSVWRKDMALIQQFALESGSPSPLFTTTKPLYEEAIRLGYGGSDTAAAFAALENVHA